MGQGRRALQTLLVVACALAGVAWATPAQAQGAPPGVVNEHAVTVESSELAVFELANTTRIGMGRRCPNQGFELIAPSADGLSFTFEERTDSPLGESQPFTGCEAAFYNITVPGPARILRLNFTADRIIENETSGPPCLGICPVPDISMTQELQLDFPDGSHRIDPYYASDAPSSPATTFTREFLLPPGTQNLTLQWFFQDNGLLGPQADVDPGRAKFTATVSNINMELAEILLPDPLVAHGAAVDNRTSGFSRVEHWANLTLPDGSIGDRRTSSLALEVRRGPSLLQMSGPQGRVPDERFQAARVGDRVRYVIDPQTVKEQGLGAYSLQFATLVPLPPAPPPPTPTTIYPFYYVLAFLPMVAGALALYQGITYVKAAEGSYKRTAWPVLITIMLVVVYYLLLLAYSFFGLGPTRMSTTPLPREPLLIYFQFVLLLIMLVFAAIAVSRTLIGNMRRDLDERARKEDQLKRSNEELERFAYVASHDLQEPLRKVAGFTALLQKRYAHQLDKDADEIIQYAVDGATRMQMLIKDILAYSRVGSKELQRVPVDVNDTMRLVVSDLSEPIKESHALVRWEALPTVRVDASQLRQILQNLVENAIKYRHPKRRPKVEVLASDQGNAWRFEVRDNGQGIPEDKHEEIFGIFRRLHGQELPGTGIGLAVAKKAVERHGGKIWVESAPGRGSTFHFTLPRSAVDSGHWGTRAPLLRPGSAGTA